ncbi:MAG: guanylate kinase [Cytophagales bacterium]|nr:guanylate kinase [Cytophagales bacterium]
MKGKCIIFSAPSGSGKTTIVKHLLTKIPNLGFSISACTRDKRGRNEQNGIDYYFMTIEEFTQRIHNNEFVEWEEVYAGNFYGTLKSEIQRLWDEGKHVIFDVDVKGGMNIKKYYGDDALAIFVKIPSIEELERRLRTRATDTEEQISRRLYKAKFELSFMDMFDVVLVNEDLDTACQEAQNMVQNFIKS